MRNYRFLLLLFNTLLVGCPVSSNAQKSQSTTRANNRPNIIFILTDDQRWSALGYAGNPLAHTPEMDKLARTGTYFKKGMVTTPICAASRASILSGTNGRTGTRSRPAPSGTST